MPQGLLTCSETNFWYNDNNTEHFQDWVASGGIIWEKDKFKIVLFYKYLT